MQQPRVSLAGVVLSLALALAATWTTASLLSWSGVRGTGAPVGSAEPFEREALAALRGGPHRLGEARAAIMAQLRRSPADPAAWARLAYVERLLAGRISPESAEALRRSGDVAPHAYGLTLWRVRFGLEHWDELSPDLRRSTLNEMRAIAYDWDGREALRRLASEIWNPSGRLAAGLFRSELEREHRTRGRSGG